MIILVISYLSQIKILATSQENKVIFFSFNSLKMIYLCTFRSNDLLLLLRPVSSPGPVPGPDPGPDPETEGSAGM